MKLHPLIALMFCVLCQTVAWSQGLPRSTPEEQGVSSAAVLSFIEAADKELDSLNSFMLVRNGRVVTEGWWAPYHAEARHSLYSLSKSFTSTAVGMAAAEGKLSVDDTVLSFFPEDAPPAPSDNLKAMRVSDLLRMNTGHDTEPARKLDEVWTRAFLAHPVPNKPGTRFLYNTSATYMQSAIVQKATGTNILEYLRPRLFEPLGIESPTWEMSPQGVATGGYGLSVRTEDIAKFGQLYLQKGNWQGKQLVPEQWVAAATALQTSNGSSPASDWDQGYGYQFWRCRHGAYRGDGAFGQYCIVIPEQQTVIAITSGLRDMQAVLNLVWGKLLPALQPSALPADTEGVAKLRDRLKSLTIKPQLASGTAPKVYGKKYVFPPNDGKLETLVMEGDRDGSVSVAMRINGVDYHHQYRSGQWSNGQSAFGALPNQPVATSGGWTEDGVFAAKICYYETPFTLQTTLKFSGDEVRYTASSNVAFGPKSETTLLGVTAGLTQTTSRQDLSEEFEAPVEAPRRATISATKPSPAAKVQDHDFAVWEKEVAAYEAQDRANPPAKGGILFVGSSTIRLWKSLATDFPNQKVLNRGIGGSEIVDSTYYVDRLITPYAPRQVYLRAGTNDLHNGQPPSKVAADFAEFVAAVHSRLPNTEIYYIAACPVPARWGEKDKTLALNKLIHDAAIEMPRVGYVDASPISLNAGGVRKELFVSDMLHLNDEGYKLLANSVRPFLPIVK